MKRKSPSQVSIRAMLLMSLLVAAGTLTAQRTLFSSQASLGTRGLKEFGDRVEAYEKMQGYAKATGKLQITVLTPEQRTQWAATFQPVHKKFESVIGKDLLDLIPGLAK